MTASFNSSYRPVESISAVLLNLFLNGARQDDHAIIAAARQAEAH